MQLTISPTSPFARKVKVALLEKGLPFEEVSLDPWASPASLLDTNPLSQVPALAVGPGTVIANSETILNWLEHAHPHPSLLPPPGEQAGLARLMATAGLANGMVEAAVQVVLERRRDAGQQSAALLARREQALLRATAALERQFHCSRDQFLLDGIGVAVALAYLDFRLSALGWRSRAPRLSAWQDWAAGRPSLRASAPPAA